MSSLFSTAPAFAAPEKTRLRLGFVPLTDCAPLVVAHTRQLGQRYGLELELVRQSSWAAVRDKLISGELDAAHTLYGLVYGVELGIGGPQADMAVLMTLNQNGQAITVSSQLAGLLKSGRTLRQIVDTASKPLMFAQTFPTGTHAMWLYNWLAREGIDPMREIRSVVIAPPEMTDAMASGLLDGFCAGEPWNAKAEAEGVGRTLLATSEIWPDHPEKVLACRRDFAALYPNTAKALIATLLDACQWLDNPAHRRECAQTLAQPEYVGCPAEWITPRFLGDYGALAQPPGLRFFGDGTVNYPKVADGAWFVQQYQRWGLLTRSEVDPEAVALQVNQSALYAEVAARKGISAPL
ncbi:CmpA/NrtA family ABC transporter substrate-binding protein [Silvimonas iriomotensis]|uniref:Nitrate ABC transporter substrate-binding protein n=1 Tax=Silvimonas iriomotensis TaxID=449662 RepID=A0ABQ2P731_9NEIS|nr:CmpA/NrtA family ABC transporter substrate-binding protein [Silvimonas iriomotensis]GGP19885.1 nitrate ABC transporter substrate-binding protein [Silvimonas iriomotensis]